VGISRSQFNYESQKKEDPKVTKLILEIKEKHPYYGMPRVLAILRRKGFIVNGKRVYRVMKVLGLLVARKPNRKRKFKPVSLKIPQATCVNEVWAMDFVHHRLSDGTAFRCFTIVDTLSRQTPGIFPSLTMKGFLPMRFLERLSKTTKLPKHIIVDNGPEFANKLFVHWCAKNNIQLHFIDPGKPVQNAYIESFNGKFRDEFLARNKFKNIISVANGLISWIKFYNTERPHSSLDYMTPKEFADQESLMLGNKNQLVLKTG